MAKRKKKMNARRVKKVKARRTVRQFESLLYVGLSPESAKEIVKGVTEIVKLGKVAPHIALEAIKVLAAAVEVKNVSLSNCQLLGNDTGVGMKFEVQK